MTQWTFRPSTTPLEAGLKVDGQNLGYLSNNYEVMGLHLFAALDYLWPPGGVVPGSGAGGGMQYFFPKGIICPN